MTYEPQHEISSNVYVRPAKAQTRILEYSMTVKLLTEHNLEFLCLKGDCIDSCLSPRLSKMPH